MLLYNKNVKVNQTHTYNTNSIHTLSSNSLIIQSVVQCVYSFRVNCKNKSKQEEVLSSSHPNGKFEPFTMITNYVVPFSVNPVLT